MHQLGIYITEHINSNLNHTIHANILNTYTLTSTSHCQSGNDLLYPLGLIVTPCPQIAYNQAMQWPQSYTNSSISLSLMDNYINMHIITNQHAYNYQKTYTNFKVLDCAYHHNQAICTLGATINFLKNMWAPNSIHKNMVRF